MRLFNTTLRRSLLACLLWPSAQAMAAAPPVTEWCRLTPGTAASAIKTYVRNMGTLYVPRDAVAGTVIGAVRVQETSRDLNALLLACRSTGGGTIWFHANAARGVYPDMPLIDGHDYNGHVLRTNVPGIGVIVELYWPFTGQYQDFWTPIDRNPPLVPFAAYHTNSGISGPELFSLINRVTLVKTGDIAPGIWDVGGELFSAEVDHDLTGKVLTYELQATVVQTQCSIVGDPVSANPVKLGEWSTSDFTGPGFTTPDVPFHIRLTSCQIDPDPANLTQATIELDGIDGSAPVGPGGANVFSLTTDSDARGMGIQMLYDGRPIPLNTEVPLQPLEDGTTLLNFHARFYQTEPSSAVRAGVAKGALNFTLRYR